VKIEVGKYYKNRDGMIEGPLKVASDGLYCFANPEGTRSFTDLGAYYVDEYDDRDLVEECNADGSPIVVQSNPLAADRAWRDEIALRVLPGLLSLGSDLECDDLPPSSTLGEIAVHHAFYIADVFLKAAKQS